MKQRPQQFYFLLAAATTGLGVLVDVVNGTLGERLGFTGMISAFAALCCAILLKASRSDRVHIRAGRLIVGVISIAFSLNFMRLAAKWGNGSIDFRTVVAALLSISWAFALGVLVMAHIEPRRQKSATKPPIYLRFETVVSMLVIVVALVAVKGLHSPTASMARDLLTGGSSDAEVPVEETEIPESVPRGARGAHRDPVKKQSVPEWSMGPIA